MDQHATIVQDVPAAVGLVDYSRNDAKPKYCGEHTRGLILIGLFKMSKASLAVLSGVAAYHLTHVDPGDLAVRLVDHLPINPVGHIAIAILDQADSISSHGLRQLGALSFLLAVLYLVEGGGLMLQKVWAEYLTVVMTAAAMPWEMYEMVERYTHIRLGLLLINGAVVVYLMVLLAGKRRKLRECA